jgi:hypothetical protein
VQRRHSWLFWLLAANLVTSVIHYIDNVAFFSIYPEPSWNSAGATDRFWFIMTPFALAGYLLYRRGWFWRSTLILQAYAAMGMLVLAHYLFAPLCDISARIHLTVLPEAAAATLLMIYLLHMQTRHLRVRQGAVSAAFCADFPSN